ncbi:MAG: NAD(P)H-hydrate dehydratase, partial [Lewinella sp.]|nr:NAD(P)H-hydrate dehydratase [Lewinella sp.]
ALIIAGSYGKVGAAILSARAALRAGCGLVTVQVPQCGYAILQIAFPEAMVRVDSHQQIWTATEDTAPFQAVGVGPGIGTNLLTARALSSLLEEAAAPLILDADALNILGQHPEWQEKLPPGSILTPHPKEFERLFGPTENDFDRLQLLRERAQALRCYIVLKGGYTAIATPEGVVYFNTNGNPGMGTAGAGDVLTGILAGLLAQGYAPLVTCCLGVWLHGQAGDLAARELEQESLLAEDIISQLGPAFKTLKSSMT